MIGGGGALFPNMEVVNDFNAVQATVAMVILSRYTCDRNSRTQKFCTQVHKSSSATKSLSRTL